MNTADFTMTFVVDQTPHEVFEAINNVPDWWTGEVIGSSHQLHDEFSYRYEGFHFTKQKLVEIIPDKKVVWLVTESNLSFLKNPKEWEGTHIIFEISERDNQTQLKFTHAGLVPQIECFRDCSNGWSQYLEKSLLKLITTGKGEILVFS